MVIFPEPQRSNFSDKKVSLAVGCGIVLGPSPGKLEQLAADVIRKALEAAGISTSGSYSIVLGTPKSNPRVKADSLKPAAGMPNADQAYTLCVTENEATLAGNEPIGALYAAQTFAQLLQSEKGDTQLPVGEIADWPNMKYRGIYSEARWSNDLMTLQDWKDAIDILASLKFNILTVGAACCWQIQYDDKLNEYFNIPIRKYPELKAPKYIDYYSPTQGKDIHFEYMPKMYEGDFFGDVVAYGMSHGITVRPEINTPGHNTLIPRMIPEISAKDENGNPIGYCFCFSNPKTYQVMFDIYDEIIDRYLKPNGVSAFHIGGDEVYKVIGMDPSEPTRTVYPFCQCDECKKRDWNDMLVDYMVALCKHLVEKGITLISMYHDQLVRSKRADQALANRLREEGLIDYLTIQWWQYGGYFETLHPEWGIRTWVMPMTGYYYGTPLADHLDNIWQACKKGHEDGAEGSESYCIFSRSFYRMYAGQAEFSWKKGGNLEDFRDKFTRYLFGNEKEGRKAFMLLDNLSGAYGPQLWAMYHYHLAYASNPETAWKKANYPQYIVEALKPNPLHIWNLLRIIRWNSQAAIDRFAKEENWYRDPARQRVVLPLECARMKASAGVFLALAETAKSYGDLQKSGELDAEKLGAIIKQCVETLAEIDDTMGKIEREMDFYLVPQVLREMTLHRNFLAKYTAEIRKISELVDEGDMNALPDLECLKCQDIRWVG